MAPRGKAPCGLKPPLAFRPSHLTLFVFSCVLIFLALGLPLSEGKQSDARDPSMTEHPGELSWEMPGRVSIYDLQFGPAVFKDNQLNFLGNSRSFNADHFGDRLTLMIRFSYSASQPEVPLKFIIRLPDSRQYEETVLLMTRSGQYAYHFTIHNPRDFVGSGSVYLYYGFSIVDMLDFTIMPGS